MNLVLLKPESLLLDSERGRLLFGVQGWFYLLMATFFTPESMFHYEDYLDCSSELGTLMILI